MAMGDTKKPALMWLRRSSSLWQRSARKRSADYKHMLLQAQTYFKQGDYAQARVLEAEVLAHYRQHLGEGSPETLTVMNNLANTMYAQQDYASAQTLFEQVLTLCMQRFGIDNPYTLSASYSLAQALNQQNKQRAARTVLEYIYQQSCQKNSQDNSFSHIALHNLSRLLCDQGQWEEAASFAEHAFVASREHLGDAHPQTTLYCQTLHNALYMRDMRPMHGASAN